MLDPALSHIHPLVASWRKCRVPAPAEIDACRSLLLTTAVHEIGTAAKHGTAYNPFTDHRFLWAIQWIDVADGLRKTVDPDVDFMARLLMDPNPMLTNKALAAADT